MARHILHVDDDPQLPERVVAVLEADGYRWVREVDPERVMRRVEEQDLALVLMEPDLQGCDGLDLLAGILQATGGEVPVLVLTRVSSDSGMHGEAIALGVTEFLSKPVLRSQLLARIRELALPAAAPAPAPVETAAALRPELSGDLADTPMPELIARLRRRGAAGVLKVHHGEAVVGIQFRNGTPICVGSARRGRASASEDEAEELVFDTFCWTEGAWEFFAGRKLPADTSSELPGDPEGLLLRGVREACPGAQIAERLRKRSTLYVSVSESCEDPLDGVELTAKQATVLAEMSGQESLGDLLASMEFEERLLYALWVAGRIELHAVPTLDLTELHAEDAAPPLEEAEPELELDDESGPVPALEVDPEPAPARERVYAPRRERIRARSKPRPRSEPRPAAARPPEPSAQKGAIAAVGPPDEISKRLRELARRVTAGDDFEVLEVPVDVSEEALREAYHRRMAEIPDGALDSPDLGVRVQAERVRDRIESAYAHLNDPESRRAYSLLRKEEDQDRQAGTAAERALEGERWFRKGRGHLEQKRYEQAAEAFGMASHLDPGEGEYLSHLGYALFLSKPGNKVVQREAMEHVANGIKRSPTREISYIYLGRILKARGDEDAALKLFRRALRVRPDSHPALQEIRLLEMRKRKSKGILSRILGS